MGWVPAVCGVQFGGRTARGSLTKPGFNTWFRKTITIKVVIVIQQSGWANYK
jgi:hypothetical protein